MIILLSLVVVFLAASSVVFVPRASGSDMSMMATVNGNTLTMNYSVSGGLYDRNVTAVALEVSRVHQGHIYVLINEGLEFKVKVSLQRLADHFNNEFSLLGSDLTATVIGTDDLPTVFSDRQATLIVGPGADLPDYYSYPAKRWVEKGGLWVGIGGDSAPFMYSLNNTDSPNATLRIDFVGMGYEDGEGALATPMAKALDMRYVAPETAFLLSDLKAAGGASVGYEYKRGDNVLATAGIVPIGDGALLIMAGDMNPPPLATGEEVLAWDLMKIVLLDVPWWSGNMQYQTTLFRSGLEGTLTMPLSGSDYVCCALLSNSDTFSGFLVQRISVRGT
ncbi:MAG: hypothetical protein SA339_01080 [Methanomassiliicoccus sp.]|nr:hypothetical protein [Methanomassiliicoccus sp.]